tara:strand:+ start:2382 stop:3110 length:729 start_codon:yes stop_codon:yes gene_type:complete
MSRISSYPLDTDIIGTDKWIGSDSANSMSTKNFTADNVMNFINGFNKVEANSLRYEYAIYYPIRSRPEGSISLAGTVETDVYFNTVTTIRISKFQLQRYEDDLGDFYSNPLVGSIIMFSQCDKISNWGSFKWQSSAQVSGSPNFYDVTLLYVSGPGFFEPLKDYFVTILEYDSINNTGDKNYSWQQTANSKVWQVTHNLNKYCAVSVTNDNKEEIYPNIEYDSLNTITLTFSSAISGYAFFN